MSRDHGAIEELLAVRALGGLDADDERLLKRELASHGDCDDCRRLADDFEETAGHLAFALDPVPVDADQADAILQRASHPATQETIPTAAASSADELEARRPRHARMWPAIGAAAAALLLVVSAVALLGPSRSADVTATTDLKVVRFNGNGGELAMAYEPGQAGAVLLGSGFSDPGPDKVFEIWMLEEGMAVSGGCVRPNDGSIVAFVDADLAGTDQMAVTVEPDSCPSQPTTTPILVSDPLPA